MMALYLYEASYTAESVAAQIKNPSDRIAAVTASIGASLGIKLLAGGYSFGDHDVVAIFDAPDDEAVAAFALVLASGGALRSAKTTKLLDGHQWVSALTKAQHVSPSYKPAR